MKTFLASDFEELKRLFNDTVLDWWKHNKRDLPWRRTSDPYQVLIAEMLLRKTTARQVATVYESFIFAYPSPKALAEADEEEVEEKIRPLGISKVRAKLLVSLGKVLVEKFEGKIPCVVEDLLSLPGVGMYSANAVRCFAFYVDVPLIDTNFVRVISRFFGLVSSKSRAHTDPKLWSFAERLIPEGKSREFNFAVLDFASLICKVPKPECIKCPVSGFCRYNNKP